MTAACVYWIRLPEHQDILSEGYIGFTSNRHHARRWLQHRRELTRDRYRHCPLYRAIEKYGDLLICQTLVVGAPEYCLDVERRLRPDSKIGWNLGVGGGRTQLGMTLSPEARAKISRAHKGKPKSESTRMKMRDASLGRPVSAEARAKISAANKGRLRSAENNEKQRQFMTGRKASAETLERMRIAQTGKTLKLETKEKLRQVNLGKRYSMETRMKQSAAHLGKKRPDHAIVVVCDRCGQQGGRAGMNRWHFQYCKRENRR